MSIGDVYWNKGANYLKDVVEQNGGAMAFPTYKIRDAFGYERLGVNVRTEIKDGLQKNGIRIAGNEVPDYQETWVLLYLTKTDGSMLVRSVLNPNEYSNARLSRYIEGYKKYQDIKKIVEKES